MIWSGSLLLCALAASLIHAFFISRIRRSIKASVNNPAPERLQGVSVIVCAKNEAEHLDELIPKILNQRHPNFELILVNDHSSDQTQQVIEQWAKTDHRVRPITLKEKAKTLGKKAALSFGISQAAHDLLLLTDADCTPASSDWIELMTAPLRTDKSVALGYGGYRKQSGLLNSIIRFETTLTAGLFLGQAVAGYPYMGVGRNLAYRKEFFYAQGGFKSHEHIASGDDDLLVNYGANKNNTAVVLDPKAFTWSQPKTTWGGLFKQKRRHQSTAHFYRTQTKITLSLYSGSILLFYACLLFIGLLQPVEISFCGAIIALVTARALYLIWQLKPIFKKFQSRDLYLWIPILEPLLICIQLIIFVWNRFSKPNHWN